MPELPEVENFRQLLLPLVSETTALQLTRGSLEKQPPRNFLSDDEIQKINKGKYCVSAARRKGKQLCLLLKNKSSTSYLFVHMGMTGRIATQGNIPKLKELSAKAEYPPPSTYLSFSAGDYEVSFSDPRKFGHVLLKESMEEFEELAPDALNEAVGKRTWILAKLSDQSIGIKALILDQKRCVSGVGNWVADEVLYQIQMHPDQAYLTTDEAANLLDTLLNILQFAVKALKENKEFPYEWLFHYRWNKKKPTKDQKGRSVTYLTSGGRTSAIVASIQKKISRKRTIVYKQKQGKDKEARSSESIKKEATAKEKGPNKTTDKISKKKGGSTKRKSSQVVAVAEERSQETNLRRSSRLRAT
ncbi:unnamed protein product [Cylindrotheca closterium]|uniref:Formamidopyrimidine-DNA glycosylase catalytic domain-containing protein n=1 Tax=Cylindrotheca closterium TaxID=2856 RepID=A0AAD2FDH4_9STRA|nr:unnamed protein product [Cylindrotheca closterium]